MQTYTPTYGALLWFALIAHAISVAELVAWLSTPRLLPIQILQPTQQQ